MSGPYFHISPARNRASILREGLRLSDSPSKYVWLLDSRAEALRLAGKRWAASAVNDVYEVDASGLEVIPDPHPGFDGITSWAVAVSIAPERVRLAATVG